MKICRIATVPFFLQNHLRGQIVATVAAGHEVTLISSEGPEMGALSAIHGIRFFPIEIPRKISPWQDLKAGWQLYRLFRTMRFDIVHSTTPKAGMVTAIAAYLAGVPVRLHTFTGQVWMEKKGLVRFLAKNGDRMTALFTTQCYADSPSQREYILQAGVVARQKIRVIGKGSLAGVDLTRFNSEVWAARKGAIRSELNLSPETQVITFIGRMAKDKGIDELISAFGMLDKETRSGLALLFVGPREADWMTLSAETRRAIEDDPSIKFVGYSSEPERYLAITDIFCLPSYREGFGNVVIEAAAMGVATVGTDIVGLRDAIVDGVTGMLVPPKDAVALSRALLKLLQDSGLRNIMGAKAQARVRQDYDASKVNAAVLEEYEQLWRGASMRKQTSLS